MLVHVLTSSLTCKQGKLPSNRQIDETLDYFVNTAPFDTNKLSREGQQLIEGFRQVVLDAKKIVNVKNQDELIQNFVWSAFSSFRPS